MADLKFLERNETWPQPPKLSTYTDGTTMELTLKLSAHHLLVLCSLLTRGALAPAEEVIGGKADEHLQKVLTLTRHDLMVVAERLSKRINYKERLEELEEARAMEPVEPNEA